MPKDFKLDKSEIRQLIPKMGYCFATDRITVDGQKVGRMCREEPDDDADSGWRFLAGDENAKYMDDTGNSGIYDVNTICNYDPDIIPFVGAPAGTAYERHLTAGVFFEVGFAPDSDAIMTDEEFAAFIDQCYKEFEEKQDILNAGGLGRFQRYAYDQETSKLRFFDGDEIRAEFSFVIAGTWAHQKNEWLWGWANESLTDHVRQDSTEFKRLATITGRDFAIRQSIEADEMKAYEITAMAVHVLSAKGMYRAPGKASHLFLVLH